MLFLIISIYHKNTQKFTPAFLIAWLLLNYQRSYIFLSPPAHCTFPPLLVCYVGGKVLSFLRLVDIAEEKGGAGRG